MESSSCAHSETDESLLRLLCDSGISLHKTDERVLLDTYVPFSRIQHALRTDDEQCKRTWVYSDDVSTIDPGVARACTEQLEFVRTLKESWTATRPHTLSIPERWKSEAQKTTWVTTDHMNAAALMHWIKPIETYITYISQDEVLRRHDGLEESFLPDFLLHCPSYVDTRLQSKDQWNNPKYTLPFFLDVITYPGDEGSADMAIPGFFVPTPGCTLYGDVENDFPPPLEKHGHLPKTFSVLHSSLGPSNCSRPKAKANFIHPALLIGIKGPARWPAQVSLSDSASIPSSMEQTLHDLTQRVEPNLIALLMNWHYQCDQNIRGIGIPSLPSYRCIPPWFMQFGLIYDAHGLVIVAHIPFSIPPSATSKSISAPLSFLSCIIDRLPIHGLLDVLPSSISHESRILGNFRAALALSCLQRHAFVMSAIMDGVNWPSSIAQDDFEEVEDGQEQDQDQDQDQSSSDAQSHSESASSDDGEFM
ncbi:hypothetical protein HETIRDRAFT_328125 [Heterobasidion irregulare TC 32-1]|uniref:Uncharacterized protein n=1 Tax=Heterobasidion irregulare (strain TC 32-1) TaxID=747525 RepID=W4JV42_HETIT|nr:uncharacterized protein HETIRDRAFT_328125 [Heterobasidion irregulare TC 32-1]ETW76950.1 hypothetical protein HETIRDRAFT_328125 [Heterobasidion irregulare TC 32-1]